MKPWFESNSQLLCWHLSLVLHQCHLIHIHD